MSNTDILTFLVGSWLLGLLWGVIWRVVTRKWEAWTS